MHTYTHTHTHTHTPHTHTHTHTHIQTKVVSVKVDSEVCTACTYYASFSIWEFFNAELRNVSVENCNNYYCSDIMYNYMQLGFYKVIPLYNVVTLNSLQWSFNLYTIEFEVTMHGSTTVNVQSSNE